MNAATIGLLAALLLAAAAAVRSLRRPKGGCSRCAGCSGACRKKE